MSPTRREQVGISNMNAKEIYLSNFDVGDMFTQS
jgi:hypothetical protein